MTTKKKHHYVDNKLFLEKIKERKAKIKECEELGLPPPPISEYLGSCIKLIAENVSLRPRFINYSYRDELIADAIENCIRYFDKFDPDKSPYPFAYFTLTCMRAFRRRLRKEEKGRYAIYKSFQETLMNCDEHLLADYDDNPLITTSLYDNINRFIEYYEDRDKFEKQKKKAKVKEGLEKFTGEDNDGEV